MQIGVIGMSCKSAPLFVRERIANVKSRISPCITVSTCHRTEIYFSGENLAEIQSVIFQDLKILATSYEHAFYSYFGTECFYHLACVTSGLDSLILAESDIQRQVKVAYEAARQKQHLPSPLHFLFQKSLKLGKTARSRFSLFQTAWHLEATLYQLVENLLGQHPRLLWVGNSDINRKIIHYFWRRGHRNMTLSTRSLEAALPFAVDYQLTLRDRKEISSWTHYDAVISATAASDYLITPSSGPIKTRLLLDLSVPRSIDPALQNHPHLTLLNMEEIGKFFDHLQNVRLHEVQSVKNFLQESTQLYSEKYARKTLPVDLNRIFS